MQQDHDRPQQQSADRGGGLQGLYSGVYGHAERRCNRAQQRAPHAPDGQMPPEFSVEKKKQSENGSGEKRFSYANSFGIVQGADKPKEADDAQQDSRQRPDRLE